MAVIEGILTVGLNVPLSALGMSIRTNVAGRPAELRLPGPPFREDGQGLQGGELTPPAFQHIQDGDQLRTWMDDDAPRGWGKVHMRGPAATQPRSGAALWPSKTQGRSSRKRPQTQSSVRSAPGGPSFSIG